MVNGNGDSEEPRGGTFIERVIAASARNKLLVIIFVLFGIATGIWAIQRTPLDAIPDLSDVQVIVYTDWEGRSPDLIEDQITYPISTEFIAAPKVKFVRGRIDVREVVRLCHFPGRDRHLLGALARDRISELGPRLAPGRRESSDRAGRDRRRLGFRVRARR